MWICGPAPCMTWVPRNHPWGVFPCGRGEGGIRKMYQWEVWPVRKEEAFRSQLAMSLVSLCWPQLSFTHVLMFFGKQVPRLQNVNNVFLSFKKNKNNCIYLFIGCAGSVLLCGLFSSCSQRGLLSRVGNRLLIAMASLVTEHGLQGPWASLVVVWGLSSCSWALGPRLSIYGTRA